MMETILIIVKGLLALVMGWVLAIIVHHFEQQYNKKSKREEQPKPKATHQREW